MGPANSELTCVHFRFLEAVGSANSTLMLYFNVSIVFFLPSERRLQQSHFVFLCSLERQRQQQRGNMTYSKKKRSPKFLC